MFYVSKMCRRWTHRAILGFLVSFPFCLVGAWAICSIYVTSIFGGTPEDVKAADVGLVPLAIATFIVPSPLVGILWAILRYIPGFSTIETTDTHLRIRKFLSVKTISRKSVEYFGLRQREMWLVRRVPSLASLPKFEEDGCPPLGQLLYLEYNDSAVNIEKRKKIVLPVFYTEAEIKEISEWAAKRI